MARRSVLLALLTLCLTGCDMFGEYQARKDATKARLQSGAPLPAAAPPAPAPGDPNAGQPAPMPMPMPMPAGT